VVKKIPIFRSLDALRGVAALWVVMDHSCDRYVSNSPLAQWPIYAFSLRGQLGVVLFFLISGYCITAAAYSSFISGKQARRFVYERIRRIYPPYFFAIVASVVVTSLLGFAEVHHLIPTRNHVQIRHDGILYWASNIFLFQTEAHQPFVNIVFWSLCYEISFYIIVSVFLRFSQSIAKQLGCQSGLFFFSFLVGALTAGSLTWPLLSGSAGPFPLDLWYQFGIGSLFFLAVEVNSPQFTGFSHGLRVMNVTMIWFTVLLIVVFGVVRSFGGLDIGHPSSRMQAVATIVFLAFFWILRRANQDYLLHPILRPLFWVGSFSYSLYLTHTIILPFIDAPARAIGLAGNLYLVTWGLQIVVATVAGWFYFLVIERHFISSKQKSRVASEVAIS
jgi:exopolysaccharide production protein ExoZ